MHKAFYKKAKYLKKQDDISPPDAHGIKASEYGGWR
jgi:hypothetical protein